MDINKLSKEELVQLVSKLNQKGNNVKVSAKGGVSVYGLGRFPVTLYKSQWTKLLAMFDQITAFIQEHESELAVKE